MAESFTRQDYFFAQKVLWCSTWEAYTLISHSKEIIKIFQF